MPYSRLALASALCAFVLSGCAQAQSDVTHSMPAARSGSIQAAPAVPGANSETQGFEPIVGQDGKDVIWVPTAQSLVDSMLDLAKVTPQDHVLDLGSGDGRTVITAARRGARAHGIEYHADMVALAKRSAQAAGVADRATFEQADIFQSDLSQASVITLFLLPDLNLKLRPKLLDLKPGTRIVSNSFTMDDWRADDSVIVTTGCNSFCRAHLWIVPAKVQGDWMLDGRTLRLKQDFQMLSGRMSEAGGRGSRVQDGRMSGEQIEFTVDGVRHIGRVQGDTMKGTIDGGAAWQATRVAGVQ